MQLPNILRFLLVSQAIVQFGHSLQYMTSLHLVTSTPSTRVVYYLHTSPATWNDATSMCNQYGATLITFSDFDATKNSISYVDRVSWNGQLNQLTTGFWSGLYKNSSGKMRWQRCTDYNAGAPNPPVTLGTDSCYLSDTSYSLSAEPCSRRRPYVCQRDDGQCWFQPYMDTMLKDGDTPDAHSNATTAADEGECGKMCRSSIEHGRECWGFTYKGGNCTMLFTDIYHKYAINININQVYFHSESDQTAYVKICTGGWVTSLAVPSVDSRITAGDENCTIQSADVWDDSVCYCECDQPPVILEAETLVMTIDEKVEKIVKELKVNPSNTSSTRRKKESADDSRPSAQSIGYFGVAFLSFVFGAICLLDLSVLLSHAITFCKSFKTGKKSDC